MQELPFGGGETWWGGFSSPCDPARSERILMSLFSPRVVTRVVGVSWAILPVEIMAGNPGGM